MMRALALAAMWMSFASLGLADEGQIRLKEGLGKERVLSHCMICHSLDYIQMNSPFQDRTGWEAVVTKMVKVMKAPIPEQDLPVIVEYLTKHYGR